MNVSDLHQVDIFYYIATHFELILHEIYHEITGLTAQDVILDVGCGDGRVLVTMAKVLGCRGIGVDISEVRLISLCSDIITLEFPREHI